MQLTNIMTRKPSRPLGVTLVAIIYLAIAVAALILAARYVLNPAGNEEMIMLFTRLKIPVTFLNLLAAPPLISAGLATLLFRGLWEETPWSRVATLFISFMAMLTALAAIAFMRAFNVGDSRAIWSAIGAFALFALIFIYFLKIDWNKAPEPELQEEPEPEVVEPILSSPAPPPPPPPPEVKPILASDHSFYNIPTMAMGETKTQGKPTISLQEEPPAPPPTKKLACLIAISGRDQGRQFDISAPEVLIGRHPALADIVLNDPTISSQHAQIKYEDGFFNIYDLESTNGTFVNQQRVISHPLRDQDRIKLGMVELVFSTPCAE